MKRGLGMNEAECAEVFARWNKGVLNSFLIEITADILNYNDEDGKPLVTKIMDSAGQKVSTPSPLVFPNSPPPPVSSFLASASDN